MSGLTAPDESKIGEPSLGLFWKKRERIHIRFWNQVGAEEHISLPMLKDALKKEWKDKNDRFIQAQIRLMQTEGRIHVESKVKVWIKPPRLSTKKNVNSAIFGDKWSIGAVDGIRTRDRKLGRHPQEPRTVPFGSFLCPKPARRRPLTLTELDGGNSDISSFLDWEDHRMSESSLRSLVKNSVRLLIGLEESFLML